MPRLLILCEYPTLLGGERSMLATLPAVTAAGFDVVVAAPPAGPLAAALHVRGVTHIAWPTHDDTSQRLPLDELRTLLAVILRDTKPALLHANSLSTARIAGPVAAESDVRSIGHLRDILKLTGQAIDDLNCHSRLIAVSEATRNFHIAQGLDAAKCVVLNNGIDLDLYKPSPPTGYLHKELGLPRETRLIAVIGQLGLRKGTDTALTAALQIAKAAPDVDWLIVGERTSNKEESREFEARLHAIAAEPPLVGRIHFLSNRTDVPQLLNECTLLTHAARQEPLGRVLLEAAACGLAVVATDVGGTREIFPAETDGALLVPADSSETFANATLSLLHDDPKRQALAAAGRRRAEAAFDVHVAAARLVDQYNIVIT